MEIDLTFLLFYSIFIIIAFLELKEKRYISFIGLLLLAIFSIGSGIVIKEIKKFDIGGCILEEPPANRKPVIYTIQDYYSGDTIVKDSIIIREDEIKRAIDYKNNQWRKNYKKW